MGRSMVFFVALGLVAAFARAQDDVGVLSSETPALITTTPVQTAWAGYLGINGGYTDYNRNLDVEGSPTSLKILASYVTPARAWVYDIGYGVQNQNFSQSAAGNSSVSGAVMELAARYQFNSRWQLGVVYNQLFNKGINYGADQADFEVGGIQILREFGLGDNYLGRAGLRVMTSLNVHSEQVNMAMIDFQIGWGGTTRVKTASR